MNEYLNKAKDAYEMAMDHYRAYLVVYLRSVCNESFWEEMPEMFREIRFSPYHSGYEKIFRKNIFLVAFPEYPNSPVWVNNYFYANEICVNLSRKINDSNGNFNMSHANLLREHVLVHEDMIKYGMKFAQPTLDDANAHIVDLNKQFGNMVSLSVVATINREGTVFLTENEYVAHHEKEEEW